MPALAPPKPESWVRTTPQGLRVEPGDFTIDPTRPAARAVITHGHGDHARAGNGAVLATRGTLAIMRARHGEAAGASLQEAAYGERIEIGGVGVTFVPAGHVLGSAQILLEWRGSRVVVSGDYKRRRDPTCPPFEPVPCDVFVTEATFGLPVFRHPPDGGEIARLLASVKRNPERAHLVGVYALGKAQRVIRLLREAGWDETIFVHGALAELNAVYEREGVVLGALAPVAGVPKPALAGKIVLAPPSALGDRWSRRLPEPLDAFASGWMRIKQRAKQRGVELPLVISDHADWDELVATVVDVGAPELWVTHGQEDALVHEAGKRGIRARALRLVGFEEEEFLNRFARLLDDLLLSPARLGKLRLMRDYFAATPDPDRGWALAALTGALDFRHAKPAAIRALVESRVDPTLFALSYDYVGDLAETAALIWPAPVGPGRDAAGLAAIVDALAGAPRREVPALLEALLDRLDADGRWALIKLVTGGLRVGVSGRLARTALAEFAAAHGHAVAVDRIEELWHGLAPPYPGLFAWLEGKAAPPEIDDALAFRPLMLAHKLEDSDPGTLDAAAFRAEWKWDGIRVQIVARAGACRVYSRTGDEIGDAFPELREAAAFDATLDGELLVRAGEGVAPFNDLQQRLNRKQADRAMRERFPPFVRLYDMLFDGGEDLRALGFDARRAWLESWYARAVIGRPAAARFDLSPSLAFAGWDDLARLRGEAIALGAEGLMLKRRDSPYLAGRPKGLWFKWKRDPHTVDAVLLYAQRGHGKRSSFYSDFTFGCWRGAPDSGGELVPVGKAYFGFTDEELARLDRWVRAHTTERFGPVRAVERALVCELAFDAVQRSTRHKSGVALRFPRIARIRWDKPAAEADAVETLERMIG